MARCLSCRAEIEWATSSSTGRPMPIEKSPGGNIVVDRDLLGEATASIVAAGAGTHVSHFATCPDAKDWRR